MSQLKKLAGQTALYGLSSILGRMAYFLLTPFHTRWFTEGQYGVITRIYAFAGVLNVLYALGMETTYFRFANDKLRSESQVFSNTVTLLLVTSSVFSGAIYFYASKLAFLLFDGHGTLFIKWVAITLAIDGLLVVPFARLRYQNRPLYFAVIRFIGIVINIGLNFFFFIYCQSVVDNQSSHWVHSIYHPSIKEGYVFLANLLANGITFLLLLPQFKNYRPRVSLALLSKMMAYGTPLFIMGISGMMMEMFGRQAFPDLLPANYYANLTPTQALGVFGACAKLAVFMTLSVQAFRYAADPFFFSQAQNKTSKPLFAQVLKWFVAFCSFMLIVISVGKSWLAGVFIDARYHQGLHIVPIMLGANLLLGVYYNLSIWFKLTDRTYFGLILGLVGLAVNVFANLIFIPLYGITGAAFANLLTYAVLVLVSYLLGKKYYPVPYPVFKILVMLLVAAAFAWLHTQFSFTTELYNLIAGLGLAFLFLLLLFIIDPQLITKLKQAKKK